MAATRRLKADIAMNALKYLIAHKNAGVVNKFRRIEDKRVSSQLQNQALWLTTSSPVSLSMLRKRKALATTFPGLTGAFIGANALERLGALGKSDSGEGLGFFGGGLIGAGTGALLSDHFSRDESLYYFSAAAWGLSSGSLLNKSIFESDDDSSRRATFELLGEISLIGGAFLAHSSLKPNLQDLITINAAGLTSLLISFSAMELLDVNDSSQARSATLLGTQLFGLGVASYLARDLEFSFGDLALIGYGALETAFYAGIITDTYISSEDPGGYTSQFRDWRHRYDRFVTIH